VKTAEALKIKDICASPAEERIEKIIAQNVAKEQSEVIFLSQSKKFNNEIRPHQSL
jgi:hypothetical protein